MKRGNIVIKPDFVKDKKRRRIIGLLLFPLSIPLITFLVFTIIGLSETVDVKAETATISISFFITLFLYIFSFYGIVSLLRGAVIITNNKFIVRKGLIRRKIIPMSSLRELDYGIRTKGFAVPAPGSAGGETMPYEIGIIRYLENGKEKEVQLPYGFYYLNGLGKELKKRLGNKITIHSKNFKDWEKWYKTSFIKKAAKVILITFLFLLYIAPPIIIWTWLSWKFNIFGFNTPWEDKTLAQKNSFAFTGTAVIIGWFILSIIILKVIDLFKKKKRGKNKKKFK